MHKFMITHKKSMEYILLNHIYIYICISICVSSAIQNLLIYKQHIWISMFVDISYSEYLQASNMVLRSS